jgi:hypothetical protein
MDKEILSEDEVEGLIKKRIQNYIVKEKFYTKADEIGEFFYNLKKNTKYGEFENLIKTKYQYISIRTVQKYIKNYKRKLENND